MDPVSIETLLKWGLPLLSGVLSGFSNSQSKDSEAETADYKSELARDNARLSDLEFYDRASKAKREGMFLCNSMKLRLRESGVSGASFETWIGQSLAEVENEYQTTLTAGRGRSERFLREADWLKGISKDARGAKKWGWAKAGIETGASLYGMYLNQGLGK